MKFQTITLIAAAAAVIGSVSSATAQTAPVSATADADGAFVVGNRFSQPDGEKMYRRVCASCHMPDAKGAVGAGFYPALAGNEKLATGAYPLYVIMQGMNGMPALGTMMTDQQAADVVNYVRTNFGNSYTDPVTAADAKASR